MAQTKVGGTWRTIKLPYTRVSGTWRPCKQVYNKVGGVWKIAFDITAADPFDGSGSLSDALTPGYAPWEALSGTWSKSSGNAVANTSANALAALETGTENVEVEIDRPTAATGGDGVAFWIQDQSNWWGVRAYTEQYFIPFSFNTFYPFNCTDSFRTRNVSTVPGNTVGGNYVSCYYVATRNLSSTANSNRFTSIVTCRTCTCNGNLSNNCSFGGLFPGTNFCPSSGACATTSFANANCTLNTKGTFCRTSSCGNVCGSCSPSTSFCAAATGFVGNTANCPSPTTFFLSSGQCTCSYPTTYSNTPNFNAPTTNPATCSCSDTQNSSSNYLSFISTSLSVPTCSNTQPCSSNNITSYTLRTCAPCNSGCTVTTFGTNTAFYKRGEIVRRQTNSFNVITQQDFGDVGNLYAYTSGNTIGFRQYSGQGRSGTASNLVTYDAGAVEKGTRHGIIVTAVPFTQSFSISRFKVNV